MSTAIYERWIQANVTQPCAGKCKEWCYSMLACFPELRLIRGHYHCSIAGKRPHWWMVAPNGCIVDPTRDQFPSMGTDEYEPWDETQEEPTGRCPNCGGYAFNGDTCCSQECSVQYVQFCKAGLI